MSKFSAFFTESRMHYIIIALLVLSIVLIAIHMSQMKKKESYGSIVGTIARFNNDVYPVSDLTGSSQYVADSYAYNGYNYEGGSMRGPSNVAEYSVNYTDPTKGFTF
jgi:hypothetical protein